MEAIKITRSNSYIFEKEKHIVIETSYWVGNYGRIITYVDWDGTKKGLLQVGCSRLCSGNI